MPVNLNPPPMPSPDTARSAQPAQPVDDDPLTRDLFAQLVAATMANAPASTAADPTGASEDKPRDSEAPREDAPPTDWMLALGGLPVAAPLVAPMDQARVRGDDDAASRAPAARIARTARPDVDVEPAPKGKQDDPSALATLDARRRIAEPTLREQLTSALAPRASGEPSPSALVANDASAHDATDARATAKPAVATSAAPFVAALAAAVEDKRGPERAAPEHAPGLEAAPVAPAPSSSIAPSAAAPVRIAIETPVGAPGFGNEVAVKLAHVIVRHDRAELRLSPAELGPVDIRIDFRNDSASLTIVAAQPATREALEQALPQLRESLAAQGIALGQAAIHDGRPQQERRPGEPGLSSPRAVAGDDIAAPVIVAGNIRLSNRLVDTFA